MQTEISIKTKVVNEQTKAYNSGQSKLQINLFWIMVALSCITV